MTQLELELNLCRKNFKFFLGYCFFQFYKSNFKFHKFHDELIKTLVEIEPGARMIINAPPRIGKTEIIKHYIAWRIFCRPNSTVIYVSYDQTLVSRKNAEIRDILNWLAKRFNIAELRIKKDMDGKTEWKNKAEGSIIARGSGNAITGGGANCIMVIDDPNKPADRSSPTILDRRNKVFTHTIRNRIDTPDVPIIIVQQRVAAMDLTGFLLTGGTNDRWIHKCYPAINEDGSALCPERLPLSEIETYKSDPFTYHSQYLQVPLDDVGKLFDKAKIVVGTVRPPINALRIVHSVDCSCKGDIGNDYNCIATVATDGVHFYVLDVLNFISDITVLLQKCREVAGRYPRTPFLFESQANGSAACAILRREMSGILEAHTCKDKVDRAMAIKYLFDAGNISFMLRGLVFGEVQQQFLAFPHGKHDDIVDAVCQGITWLQALPKSQQFIQPATVPVGALSRPVFRGIR